MLRVKEEELFLRERRDNSHHRRRRYSEDYDSEVDLYQQYKAAGFNTDMVQTSQWILKICTFDQEVMDTTLFLFFLIQLWASDDDDEPPFSPVIRKKAIKVKHVKRREKKFDKKVSFYF